MGEGDFDKAAGKSSGGWCFSLHVTDTIRSLDDWKEEWQNGIILDEYDSEISQEDMLGIITVRSWASKRPMTPEELDRNHAFYGPNGLLRHRIEAGHCIGHGDGTWDLIMGEFS